MKIVFDNAEQKEKFMNYLVEETCPSVFGLEEYLPHEIGCVTRCKTCWKRAIEIEVKEEA